MLDARCIFKKRVGFDDNENNGEDFENKSSSEDDDVRLQMVSKFANTPMCVKWEPYIGKIYAVLFTRSLEIYSVDSDTPLHKITFDSTQTGFDFLK
jgi:hypothetical protein